MICSATRLRIQPGRNWVAASWIGLSALQIFTLFLALSGCGSEPPAAGSGPRMSDGAYQAQHVLSSRDESQINRTFSSLADGHATVHAPAPAVEGVRWDDVPIAVVYGCEEAQMAVSGTVKHDWGYEFQLKTVEGYPGVLLVKRMPDPSVYQATVSVGMFNDHRDRAEELLTAFDRQMRAFGKKRQFNN